MKKLRFKSFWIWILIFAGALTVAQIFYTPSDEKKVQTLSYSSFLDMVKSKEVINVIIQEQDVSGTLKNGQKFSTFIPKESGIVAFLNEHEVPITAKPIPEPSGLSNALISWLPMILFIGI